MTPTAIVEMRAELARCASLGPYIPAQVTAARLAEMLDQIEALTRVNDKQTKAIDRLSEWQTTAENMLTVDSFFLTALIESDELKTVKIGKLEKIVERLMAEKQAVIKANQEFQSLIREVLSGSR
jgi:hypothetical protein